MKTEFTITPESQVEIIKQKRISDGWLCEFRTYVSFKSGYESNLFQIWSKPVSFGPKALSA
jgi:hypothetical protein